MLENIRGHSRGSIPPLRMPSPLPHDLCHEWNVSRRLPAKSHGQRSLAGYTTQSRRESDTTKQCSTDVKSSNMKMEIPGFR